MITAKSLANDAAGGLASEIKEEVTHQIRHKAYRESYDKMRDIPVVGEVMSVRQHVNFFSRFKKKKNDNIKEDEQE